MPHQCTNCSLTFDDGSKQMLGGCPECGGNKFQFLPGGVDGDADGNGGAGSAPAPESSVESRNGIGVAGESTDVGADSDTGRDSDIIEAPSEPVEAVADGEDRAQALARRDVVTEDELPATEATYGAEEAATPTADEDRPGLAQLREELNEQFESIKILRPGEYELNLMELYDRDEYIIALEEDGRYVIDVPDSWRRDG